jgi:hypothetical protein
VCRTARKRKGKGEASSGARRGKELGFARGSEEIKREEGVTRSAWWLQGEKEVTLSS